jgi:hypothetical protein
MLPDSCHQKRDMKYGKFLEGIIHIGQSDSTLCFLKHAVRQQTPAGVLWHSVFRLQKVN